MIDSDDLPSNPRAGRADVPRMSDLVEARLNRRTFLGTLVSAAGALATGGLSVPSARAASSAFDFPEITRGSDRHHHVPPGYETDVILKWGDHLFDQQAPAFDPARLTEADQLQRFGYNNDYIGFVPLEARGGKARGLLCVNHEYSSSHLMFPGIPKAAPRATTADQVRVEMAAHGGSVVELEQDGNRWKPVTGSRYNRRITPHRTPMQITGPAAGHERLKTSSDPTGRLAAGTMNNCAGGITPWGTWLMAEENFNHYFLGQVPASHEESGNHRRYGLVGGLYQWGRFDDRYNLAKEPREPNRFGWVVEVDPRDPEAMPKKRTALGRFKHEGAETVIAPDGRVVVYMGDDQRFDYVYKFVTADVFTPGKPQPDLLDHGTLSVARFGADGFVDWLPLVHGEGPLTAANGFHSQGDVLLETRRAADLLGATPMDRPEDVQPDPASGRAWIMLTNNHKRQPGQVNIANQRARNLSGHIIEIVEPEGDFAALRSRWEILVQCGNPADPASGSTWHSATSEHGWFTCPDNGAVDPAGRLWVATDGNKVSGAADGLWAIETTGPQRGTGRAFFRAPVGAEVCGPLFSPDGKTLFLAVQHPGDGSNTHYHAPGTRWPDFDQNMPPRPSVIAVRQKNGRPIGSG